MKYINRNVLPNRSSRLSLRANVKAAVAEHSQEQRFLKDAARLIVGITGASGAVDCIRLLELLKDSEIETHLIISRAAQMTIAAETDFKIADVEALADVIHPNRDVGGACSSGSFQNLEMVIAPCSVKTMAEIATGVTPNLISRAPTWR